MFKVKFIAKGSPKTRPYIKREHFEETSEHSVDEYVREYVREALFRHGFREVRVVVQRLDDLKVLHAHETLTVKIEGGRR